MEQQKNLSKINSLPTYDKLSYEKCIFSFKRHIINNIENIPEIKKNLLNLSLDGKTGIENIRSFSWKIYLNTLSSKENTSLKTWLEETMNLRNEFKKKMKELMNIKKYRGDPLGGFEGQWGDFFDKADIKHLIKIDVDRTFQDRDLFQENSIKEIEYNILYIFSKINQLTSYKQGMNDILAMLIYSLYPYYRKSKIKEYNNELFNKWVENPFNNIEDIYNFFHDENYFQSDLFYLMVNLMKFGVNKFYEDIDEKNNKNGETKNYLVKRCEYISEKKLKLQNSRLYYHFVNIGIDPSVVLLRWIKCLFTREFHPQDCSIIWDVIFANEIIEPTGDLGYVDFFSIAMLDFISDELLRKDQSECFRRLFHYPPLESMNTLISLTSSIKPKIIELEKLEIKKEKEWKEKTIRNKQQLDLIAEQNKKLKKEFEENIEKNKQIANNNNINNINNFIFANQFNLIQNPNIFINDNTKYHSPQLNNIQNQNQQIFPQMNIMFNNSTNNLININNREINNKNEKKENKDKNKSPLDLIKTTYSESIEDKNKLFEELKTIINKYKSNFNFNDRVKTNALLDQLKKKL